MQTFYDFISTRFWQLLLEPYGEAAHHRRIEHPALEADFWAKPVLPLPPWYGWLGEFVFSHTVVGESETGYLSAEELKKALLEAHMVQHRCPTSATCRLLVVAEKVSDRMIKATLGADSFKQIEAGRWDFTGVVTGVILALRQLEFRDETATCHLLAKGPHQQKAVEWLLERASPPLMDGIVNLMEESCMMNEQLGTTNPDPILKSRVEAFYRSVKNSIRKKDLIRERNAGMKEGRDAGMKEGRDAGMKEGRDAGLKEGRDAGLERGQLEGEGRALRLVLHLPPIPDAELTKTSDDQLRLHIEQLKAQLP